ncbi:MAG: primosomal protein N' [Bacilli bacterium]
MLVSVVAELNNHKLDQPFLYMVDFAVQNNIRLGSKVVVPFGNRFIEGFVLEIIENYEPNNKYKYVKSVTREYLNDEQLLLIKYLRSHSTATMIECINTILPLAFRAKIKKNEKIKFVKCLSITGIENDLKSQYQHILKYVSENKHCTLNQANKMFGNYIIKKLRNINVLKIYEIEDYRLSLNISKTKYYNNPSREQLKVIIDIFNSKFNYHLIHGVTGSGKTICYIELIKKYIKLDKEVLLLVPEISLTSHILNVISFYFNDNVAVFHSKMSSLEKYDQFRRVCNNNVKIAVGTRSAIFLPFKSLALIIIDEEHDNSYIQESNVSYSTKEIAFLRSKYHDAKVVLGSATPDVVTYYNTKNNKIILHNLSKMYSEIKMVNECIDMKSNFEWILSKNLENKIIETIKKNEQFILLLNRRGYANYVICSNCGEAYKCKKCDVTLNLHINNTFICHKCNYRDVGFNCNCGSREYFEYGYGIQKLEEVLFDRIKDLKIMRVDSDMLNNSYKLSEIMNDFTNNKYHGLIGTQILSKGLNFINVSLIAIIDADYMLNINSYKASENTFQYICQSLGRNSRGYKNSYNLIQSYDIKHYSFKNAINNDYITFYNNEILFRKQLNYPPFVKYLKILGLSSDNSILLNCMYKLYNYCLEKKLNVSKPHYPSVERINMQNRVQILVKYSHFSQIFDIINKTRDYNKIKNIRIIVNCNPIDF